MLGFFADRSLPQRQKIAIETVFVGHPAYPSIWTLPRGELRDKPNSKEITLEPIREVPIYDEKFAARRLSMMRIMARRTNAATVVA